MSRRPPRPSRRSLLAGLTGVAAAGLSFGGLEGCAAETKVGANGEAPLLNLYNWDTYTGKTTLADFKAATGVEVKMSLFATNDELFAKLKAGNPGFDVIMPSNEYVTRMRLADMLEPIDHAKTPNIKNILPQFMDVPFDPGRKYSIPYTWLVLGIGYRKSKVQGVPDSWKWVMDSDRYKGRVGMFSEADDMVELGAKYLGHSVRNIPDDIVKRVEAMYIANKPNIRTFHDDNGQDLLLAGDVDLVMEYNGDIAQVMTEDPDLDFVVPKEGSIINSDGMCIPKGAPRPLNAHAFINFVLDPLVGAGIYDTIRYPTPNGAALAKMPASYRDDPVIFPPAAAMARCEYADFEGVERSQLYDETVTRIRAA